jgi:carboxypeptidase C (cathepsin A)
MEGPYYEYSGRSAYDIRYSSSDDVPPVRPLVKYLNQAPIQNALGVNLNWTAGNREVQDAFAKSGDIVYADSFEKLESLLEKEVRVVLYYGDADYICNWFGGEAVSLAVNYTHAAEFRASGYEPFVVDGVEYGAVREKGNFSFVRIYDCGHQVPYFQRKVIISLLGQVIRANALNCSTCFSGFVPKVVAGVGYRDWEDCG